MKIFYFRKNSIIWGIILIIIIIALLVLMRVIGKGSKSFEYESTFMIACNQLKQIQ